MDLRRFTGNASTRSSKKAIPVHYTVRLSQHTIYCGMGPKTPPVNQLYDTPTRFSYGARIELAISHASALNWKPRRLVACCSMLCSNRARIALESYSNRNWNTPLSKFCTTFNLMAFCKFMITFRLMIHKEVRLVESLHNLHTIEDVSLGLYFNYVVLKFYLEQKQRRSWNSV